MSGLDVWLGQLLSEGVSFRAEMTGVVSSNASDIVGAVWLALSLEICDQNP